MRRAPPPIPLPEEAEELRNIADHFRRYEVVYLWDVRNPQFMDTLSFSDA